MMETITPQEPTILVITGAAGDLTWRKLMPSLYDLFLDKWLPELFAVVGIDKIEMSDDQFRSHMRDGVNQFSRFGKAAPVPKQIFGKDLFRVSSVIQASLL